jgi:ankyrin repeat protein
MNVPKIILTMLLATSALCATEQRLISAVRLGNLELTQQLIEQDADVNAQDLMCWTTLMHAALNGNTCVAKLLIACQANVNIQNPDGYMPLMIAAMEGRSGTVRALLDAKADLSLQNCSGETALEVAQRYNRIEITKIIAQESRLRLQEEVAQLRTTAHTLCAIGSYEDTILSVIPNELLFLILGHISPDGFERLLPQNHDQK